MKNPVDEPETSRTIGDLLVSVVGDIRSVMDDIRHKVVEEPWFGRAVTPDIAPAAGIQQDRDAQPVEPSAQREWVRGKEPTLEEMMAERSKMPERDKEQQRAQAELER
jgi:hypothetical protein